MKLTESQTRQIERLLWTFGANTNDLLETLEDARDVRLAEERLAENNGRVSLEDVIAELRCIQWVPVAEAMPDKPQEPYLTLDSLGVWRKGYYTGNRSIPWIKYNRSEIAGVTHWAEVRGPHAA